MAPHFPNPSVPVGWVVLAILRMAGLALLEALWSLLIWPFVRRKEEVELIYVDTPQNQQLIAGCPAVRTFSCCPWALGPHAQTFFGIIKLGRRPVPRTELVTMPDGVQITLLWFEPEDASADAPLVVSLHGIGGDENSVRPIRLAEECLRRRWRSVMYLRRGHGNSSLLPVGTTAGAEDKTPAEDAESSPPRADSPDPPPAAALPDHLGGTAQQPTGSAAAASTAAAVDDGGPGSQPSALPPAGCLPHNLHILGGQAAPEPEVDVEALRRTRKAFPQHADTEDFQLVMQHIRAARPQAPLAAVGFSMGSNVLVKYLGEQTGTSEKGIRKNPLVAAVSVSNGYDIVEGTRRMATDRHLADRIITAALHKLLRRKLPEVNAICAAHGVLIDFDEVLACNNIRDFERLLMLPISGEDNVDDYYKRNNCKDALQKLDTPLLCLSARDDPIIHSSLLRLAEEAAAVNPNMLLAVTRRGGHLGWMEGWAGRSWMMDVIVQFVDSAVQYNASSGDAATQGAGKGSRSRHCSFEVDAVPVAAAAVPVAAAAVPVAAAAAIASAIDVAVVTAAVVSAGSDIEASGGGDGTPGKCGVGVMASSVVPEGAEGPTGTGPEPSGRRVGEAEAVTSHAVQARGSRSPGVDGAGGGMASAHRASGAGAVEGAAGAVGAGDVVITVKGSP